MKTVFEPTKGMIPVDTSYCPGCTHGIAHRIIMEVLEERGSLGNTIGVVPIGCAINAHHFMNVDMCESTHGRAPAIAAGIRRVHPDQVVFTYQGDGDLASIGTAEIIHAAHRGEKFTTFFINNAIYGMTGGQMAPTTMLGQVASTAPYGRETLNSGYPVQMAELMATMPGVVYSERVTVTSPANVAKCKKALKKAFELQLEGKGLSFVEVLSPCPTGWKMAATKSLDYIDEVLTTVYPLGVKKDATKEEN